MTRYKKHESGEWDGVVRLSEKKLSKLLKIGCCDCGLVHDAYFWLEDGILMWNVSRNNRATAAMRKAKRYQRSAPEPS